MPSVVEAKERRNIAERRINFPDNTILLLCSGILVVSLETRSDSWYRAILEEPICKPFPSSWDVLEPAQVTVSLASVRSRGEGGWAVDSALVVPKLVNGDNRKQLYVRADLAVRNGWLHRVTYSALIQLRIPKSC